MSNTSSLSPYSSEASAAGSVVGLAGACVVGAIVGGVALVKWLSEETAQDRAAYVRLHEDQRRERLRCADGAESLDLHSLSTTSIKTVKLNIR